MAKVIVDTTGHGAQKLLIYDLKRHFSSQENLDSVTHILVDPFNRRKIQKENWDNIVLPLVVANNLKLPFYREDKTNLLYLHESNDSDKDEYAIEGACNASS